MIKNIIEKAVWIAVSLIAITGAGLGMLSFYAAIWLGVYYAG